MGYVRDMGKDNFFSSFDRKLFFQEVRVNLFISCSGLESVLGRLNQ